MEETFVEHSQDLAYDLRQTYAKIVGIHMVEAEEAMSEGNFYKWFRSLENIKTVTKHKFKNNAATIKKYNELVKVIKELANKYPATWTGKSLGSQEEVAKIDEALRELEEFLYQKMEEGGVFGEKGRIRGL